VATGAVLHQRGLTSRSSGPPTAGHRRPLSSNVRPRRTRISTIRSVSNWPTLIRMGTAVQSQPLRHLECRARFARAAEAAQSIWSRPPEAAMKDRGVAPEVLQYEKHEGRVVGRGPISAARPARISLSRRSRLESWRRSTAKRELHRHCSNRVFESRLRGQRRHHPPTRPNQSLKRTANGRTPGPRGGSVYHPPRGPGVLPLAAA